MKILEQIEKEASRFSSLEIEEAYKEGARRALEILAEKAVFNGSSLTLELNPSQRIFVAGARLENKRLLKLLEGKK